MGYIDISIIPLLLQSASSKKPVSHIFPSRLHTPRQWRSGASLLLACRSWFCPFCPNSMFRAATSAAWNQVQCIYTVTTAQRYQGRIPPPCQGWVTGTHLPVYYISGNSMMVSGETGLCCGSKHSPDLIVSATPKCIFRSHFVHHIRWLCLVWCVPVTPGFTEESAGHDLLSSPPQWERRSGSLYLEVTWPRSHVTSLNWPKKVTGYINLRRARKWNPIVFLKVGWVWEQVKTTWLPVDPQAGPRQSEGPHPLPCPRNVHSAYCFHRGSCSQDTALKE